MWFPVVMQRNDDAFRCAKREGQLAVNPATLRGKTGKNAIAASERTRQVIELRRQGYSLGHIARELGYASPSGPANVLRRWMRRYVGKSVEQYRAEEMERLRVILKTLWPMAIDAVRGEEKLPFPQQLAAISQLLRVIELRARLAGCFAVPPTQPAAQKQDNESRVDVEVRIEELRKQGPEAMIAAYMRIINEVPDD